MINEIKKNGKIIDELVTFFLKKKYHQLKMDLNYSQEKTIITIFLGKLTDREFDLIKECFSQKRDRAMEEYGWVLMGESEVSSELNLVGMCVDEFRMERIEEDFVMIELTRYHRIITDKEFDFWHIKSYNN